MRDGDVIAVDVPNRTLTLEISEAELVARLKAWKPPVTTFNGGYAGLYVERVMQADVGADFDFLVGCRGAKVERDSH